MLRIKRVYEKAQKDDGFRILVDRLWSRGVSKEKAKVDLWLKEVGPSDGLRKWFGHDVSKWEEFRKKFREELKAKNDLLDEIRAEMKKGNVTLVFASRDEQHNNAVVLQEYFEKAK